MISKRVLVREGYNNHEEHKYQKCVKDTVGKRYFINVEFYDLTEETKGYKIPKSNLKGFVLKVQFQRTHITTREDICPDIKIDVTYCSLKDIEQYIDRLWITSGCPYYEDHL